MPIRVLLVDDSAVIRGLMAKALSADADIEIAGSAVNGGMAIDMAKNLQPDIILLDIEMPVMDGITALPQLLKISPGSRVIMASTLTVRNAAISIEALEKGATDYVAKPSAKVGGEVDEFYRELIAKVKALGVSKIAPTVAVKQMKPQIKAAPVQQIVNPPLNMTVKALAIASSTGGPQALITVFEQFKGKLNGVPIFITQHMPATFTKILAEHISKAGERVCIEGVDGMVAKPGCAYLAPGDYHMLVEKNAAGETVIRLNQNPPENFCRPAADPMLRSLSKIYGKNLLMAVLTGMGSDGMEGAKEVAKNGGRVIAQDELSCVVYGMPKAIVDNKLANAILPLAQMGGYITQQVEGRP